MRTQELNRHKRTGFMLVMLTVLTWVTMAPAQALTIIDSKLEELTDRTLLTLQFDQPLNQKPALFRMANPTRQVVDFSVELSNKSLPVEFSAESRIKRSQLIAAGGKSRLVFELAQNYEVQAQQSENSVQLVFSGPKPFIPGGRQAAVLPPNSALTESVKVVFGKPALTRNGPVLNDWSVSEQRGKQVLRMVFDRESILADAALVNDRLRIRLANAQVGAGVATQLPTRPGSSIAGLSLMPGDQTLVVQMNLNQATHVVRQRGSVLEVEVTPMPIATPSASRVETTLPSKDQTVVARYNGRPISLDFKDADIRTVMQVFADFTKMNLVLSDSVQGNVTVFLKDVPWDQALDIVMRSKGLVSSQSGNVLLVSTPSDVGNDQFQTANRRAQDEMEPLLSKVFQISYQKTADLVTLIKSEDSKLLSARGTLISDERTSQIFVQDTPTRLERISMIVNGLDKPVKQVMIEARVVLADTSVSKDLGVRIQSASSGADAFTEVGDQFGRKGFVDTSPLSSTTLAYTLFNASSTRLINLQLRALETDNKIRTVSNPRVITSNKEPALIEQGTEIPYQIATSSGATATEFKEANLKLAVTPQIAPDGTVLLDVDIAKDSIGISTVNGPAIDTRRVKTKVLVADGGTVVLGGIFEEDDNVLNEKVPFLGDIPGLGALFKGKTDTKRRAELLIFLTPVVLADQ
jgi:type IV pilus assembly protein PilQ